MKRRTFFLSLAGTATAGVVGLKVAGHSLSGRPVRVTRESQALGASVRLTVFHPHEATAARALDDAFAELDSIESVLSLYRPTSDICRLNAAGQLAHADPALIEVVQFAQHLSRHTDGAFDITVQSLWKAYAKASAAGAPPSDSDLRAALDRTGWERVKVVGNRVRLEGNGTEITLNGIAQGYAADKVADVLRRHGILSALIDTGEINSIGHHAEKPNWTVGIRHPRATDAYLDLASLNGRCLATSGDYETRFGEGYENHHLIDPKTGRSPRGLSSITIAAPSAMEADGWSTALFMMQPEEALRRIEHLSSIDGLLVTKDGKVMRSAGFPSSSLFS